MHSSVGSSLFGNVGISLVSKVDTVNQFIHIFSLYSDSFQKE